MKVWLQILKIQSFGNTEFSNILDFIDSALILVGLRSCFVIKLSLLKLAASIFNWRKMQQFMMPIQNPAKHPR